MVLQIAQPLMFSLRAQEQLALALSGEYMEREAEAFLDEMPPLPLVISGAAAATRVMMGAALWGSAQKTSGGKIPRAAVDSSRVLTRDQSIVFSNGELAPHLVTAARQLKNLSENLWPRFELLSRLRSGKSVEDVRISQGRFEIEFRLSPQKPRGWLHVDVVPIRGAHVRLEISARSREELRRLDAAAFFQILYRGLKSYKLSKFEWKWEKSEIEFTRWIRLLLIPWGEKILQVEEEVTPKVSKIFERIVVDSGEQEILLRKLGMPAASAPLKIFPSWIRNAELRTACVSTTEVGNSVGILFFVSLPSRNYRGRLDCLLTGPPEILTSLTDEEISALIIKGSLAGLETGDPSLLIRPRFDILQLQRGVTLEGNEITPWHRHSDKMGAALPALKEALHAYTSFYNHVMSVPLMGGGLVRFLVDSRLLENFEIFPIGRWHLFLQEGPRISHMDSGRKKRELATSVDLEECDDMNRKNALKILSEGVLESHHQRSGNTPTADRLAQLVESYAALKEEKKPDRPGLKIIGPSRNRDIPFITAAIRRLPPEVARRLIRSKPLWSVVDLEGSEDFPHPEVMIFPLSDRLLIAVKGGRKLTEKDWLFVIAAHLALPEKIFYMDTRWGKIHAAYLSQVPYLKKLAELGLRGSKREQSTKSEPWDLNLQYQTNKDKKAKAAYREAIRWFGRQIGFPVDLVPAPADSPGAFKKKYREFQFRYHPDRIGPSPVYDEARPYYEAMALFHKEAKEK